jgi:hypothetical protein
VNVATGSPAATCRRDATMDPTDTAGAVHII